MLMEEQAAAVQDFDKAQKALEDQLRKESDAWTSSMKEIDKRLDLLRNQAETQATKRAQEQQKQILEQQKQLDDMVRQLTDAAKAQAAASSSAAQLEARFARLEALVTAALGRR